jgi:alkylation response protein AidB-like acyl-CoA dehydrogenase
VERCGGPRAHRELRKLGPGFDKERVKTIAEVGWLSLMVPEKANGLGMGMTELALALEQGGRGLLTEPVNALAACARAVGVGRAATGAGTEQELRRLISGENFLIPVLQDPTVSDEKREPVFAEHYHYGYQLTGVRTGIPFAEVAEGFLVDANTSDGIILIIVPRDTLGITVKGSRMVDGTAHGTIDFSEVTLMADDLLIAGVTQGETLAADIHDRILLGVSAEMLGVMEQALDLAVGYMQTREQFGRPIGSFQALQHRAVNDHIQVELVRSLLYQVCGAIDAGHGSRTMVAAVKARASEAVLSVTKSVIQMHGAIGFTDEYDAGLYLRRAMALASLYGNAAEHRERYMRHSRLDAEKASESKKRHKRKRPKKSIFAT